MGRPPKGLKPEPPDNFDPDNLEIEEGEDSTKWSKVLGVPAGIDIEARNRLWEGKEFDTRIYQMVPMENVPGREKAVLLKRVPNTVCEDVDDAWLMDNGFSGRLRTLVFWKHQGKDIRMLTGTYEIAPQPEKPASGTLTPPVVAGSPQGGPEARGNGGMVFSLKDLVILREVFGPGAGGGNQTHPELLGIEAMERSFERRMKRIDELEEKALDRTYKPVKPPTLEKDDTPAWQKDLMNEFGPKIKKWIGRLIGDDEVGEELRSEILSNSKFKEVWNDMEKKGRIAKVLVGELGDKGQTLWNLLEKQINKTPG